MTRRSDPPVVLVKWYGAAPKCLAPTWAHDEQWERKANLHVVFFLIVDRGLSNYFRSPYLTPSHAVGSSGVVQSTRCFLNAGILMKSPTFISTMLSANCNRAAPFSTITHSCCGWSYQKSGAEAWPWDMIRSMRTSAARMSVWTTSLGECCGRSSKMFLDTLANLLAARHQRLRPRRFLCIRLNRCGVKRLCEVMNLESRGKQGRTQKYPSKRKN